MTTHCTERASPKTRGAGLAPSCGSEHRPLPLHTLQSVQEGPSCLRLTESPQRRRGGAGGWGASPTEMEGEAAERTSRRSRAENRSGPRPERQSPDLESQAARHTRKPFSAEHSGEASQPALEKQPQPGFCGRNKNGAHAHFTTPACSVLSHSVRPHGLQPARLLCPWDSPGQSPGGGCHFLLQGTPPPRGCLLHLLHWQLGSLSRSHLGSPPTLLTPV